MMRPELLIPAGNLEKLRTAVLYGADAVYVGVAGLSLRAAQAEFSLDELRTGVIEAHRGGVKVYAALNTFARNSDFPKIELAVETILEAGIDAVILSDPGILRAVRRISKELPIHLSTQANTTNTEAVKFWQEHGVSRIVPARELNLAEVAAIAREAPGMELEVFVHGAMCVAYSGRCLLSAHRNRRSSNRGDCTQPCRWEYRIAESTRPDDPIILEQDQRYTYLLNSKDLCMIRHIPQIMRAGVASLKVEGRMKSVYYVAAVTRVYRQAIDAWLENPEGCWFNPEWTAELEKTSYRGYTTGFYFSEEKVAELTPERKYFKTHALVGTVLEYRAESRQIMVGVRNHLNVTDEVDLLLPDEISSVEVAKMTDGDGLPLQVAHNGYRVLFPVEGTVPVGAVLRRKIGVGNEE
jgi:putative protease